MAVPNVRETFRDGGLSGGALAPRRSITMGVALSGALGLLSLSSPESAKDTYGGGPLAEALALKLVEAGGPQYGYRIAASVNGTVGNPVSLGAGASLISAIVLTGTSGAVLACTGTPAGSWSIVVKVTTAGLTISAGPKVRISLDGGLTWGPETTVVASMPLSSPVATGLTLGWTDGTFVEDDTYVFTASEGRPSGTGTISVAGHTHPTDAYGVQVRITRAGLTLAAATAAFEYSLDGGDTWSPEIAVPSGGTYDPPGAGLRFTFADGVSGTSFEVDDGVMVWSTAPGFTLSDLQAAFADLAKAPDDWEFVHVVGTSSAATAAGVATLLSTMETAHRFVWALLEARAPGSEETEDEWIAALAAEYPADGGSALVAPRVAIAAGACEVVSPLTLRQDTRHAGSLVAARVAAIPLGQDVAWVGYGPFSKLQVVSITHDASLKDTLDSARFCTLRTVLGKAGFFVTNGFTMAAKDSDYHRLVNRRVIDEAARTVRPVAVNYLSASVRLNPSGTVAPLVAGAIYEPDARAIDVELTRAAKSAVVAPGHATAAAATVSRTTVLSTEPPPEIPVTVSVEPLGYLRSIQLVLGFRNPAAA